MGNTVQQGSVQFFRFFHEPRTRPFRPQFFTLQRHGQLRSHAFQQILLPGRQALPFLWPYAQYAHATLPGHHGKVKPFRYRDRIRKPSCGAAVFHTPDCHAPFLLIHGVLSAGLPKPQLTAASFRRHDSQAHPHNLADLSRRDGNEGRHVRSGSNGPGIQEQGIGLFFPFPFFPLADPQAGSEPSRRKGHQKEKEAHQGVLQPLYLERHHRGNKQQVP